MSALITDDGIVTRWPLRAADRVLVLDFLAAKFEPAAIMPSLRSTTSSSATTALATGHCSGANWSKPAGFSVTPLPDATGRHQRIRRCPSLLRSLQK